MIKFKILKAINGQYYCTIIAGNNKVLFTSETYRRKEGVLNAIRIIDRGYKIIDTTLT